MRTRWVALVLLSSAGCLMPGRPISALEVRMAGGPMGWHRVTPLLSVDATGALWLPPTDAPGDPPAEPYMQRVRDAHLRQLTPVQLQRGTPCEQLTGGAARGDGPVWVLVHGIGGMGEEWVPVIPTLARTRPAAMFAFKWFGYSLRGAILEDLQQGIERLAACYPRSTIVVLGHSAGGVLGAFVASRLQLGDPPHPVAIITVASPLSGVGVRPPIDDADDDTHFFNDLGSTRRAYPAAAPGVVVLHLRTHWPADAVMRPNRAGYAPNALSAVVKGARVVDLPRNLGHDDSLLWVARQLAAGGFLDLAIERLVEAAPCVTCPSSASSSASARAAPKLR